MGVKRIVANLATNNVAIGEEFYRNLLDLEVVMDLGWIVTYASGESMPVQISIASEGGSGTVVPELSIEVDNLEEVYKRATDMELEIVYPLTDEPWGVRRFYVRDPFGKVVNVLEHRDPKPS